jgi:hypothetical protein
MHTFVKSTNVYFECTHSLHVPENHIKRIMYHFSSLNNFFLQVQHKKLPSQLIIYSSHVSCPQGSKLVATKNILRKKKSTSALSSPRPWTVLGTKQTMTKTIDGNKFSHGKLSVYIYDRTWKICWPELNGENCFIQSRKNKTNNLLICATLIAKTIVPTLLISSVNPQYVFVFV